MKAPERTLCGTLSLSPLGAARKRPPRPCCPRALHTRSATEHRPGGGASHFGRCGGRSADAATEHCPVALREATRDAVSMGAPHRRSRPPWRGRHQLLAPSGRPTRGPRQRRHQWPPPRTHPGLRTWGCGGDARRPAWPTFEAPAPNEARRCQCGRWQSRARHPRDASMAPAGSQLATLPNTPWWSGCFARRRHDKGGGATGPQPGAAYQGGANPPRWWHTPPSPAWPQPATSTRHMRVPGGSGGRSGTRGCGARMLSRLLGAGMEPREVSAADGGCPIGEVPTEARPDLETPRARTHLLGQC